MRRSDGPALLGCLLLVLGLFLSLQMRSSDVSQSDAAVPDAADSGEDAAGANAFVAVTPTERPPRGRTHPGCACARYDYPRLARARLPPVHEAPHGTRPVLPCAAP